MPSTLRTAATDFSGRVVEKFPQVKGICLYGSVARGDDDDQSDIDLLILGDDPTLSPSIIRRRVREIADERVSIVYHTSDTFEEFVRTQNRFLVHIQLEGEVLHDEHGTLTRIQNEPPMKGKIADEVQDQLCRLRIYEKTSRFNGNFIYPLSHAHAIGKGIVMAILAENDVFEFRRDEALNAFIELFPTSKQDIETVRRLAPFYAAISKRANATLPFAPHGCESELKAAVDAIQRIAQFRRG